MFQSHSGIIKISRFVINGKQLQKTGSLFVGLQDTLHLHLRDILAGMRLAAEWHHNLYLGTLLLHLKIYHLCGESVNVDSKRVQLISCFVESCGARFLAPVMSCYFLPWPRLDQKIVSFMAPTPDRPNYILPRLDRTETIYHQPEIGKFQTTINM